MHRIIPIIFIFLCTHTFGHSLKGIIYNEEKVGLVGVLIHNISTNHHAHTDEEGHFVFEHAAIGDTLQLSLLGYIPKQIILTSLLHELKVTLSIDPVILGEVVISPKVNALKLATDIDIQTSPVKSSQEILRKVPGITIGQHAGGGKAEQLFLRGFDIDHGTDINITVDGMAVNMVSHAHGQGYADMHFLIPETIDKIDWGKGPYHADKGNFATAGYVNFQTKEKLDENKIKLEVGQFNTKRILSMLELYHKKKQSVYFASEYLSSDGPFDSPQNFGRLNLFGKYHAILNDHDRLNISLSHFTSQWDASGQIPQRAIDRNIIGRFGAIDDTEGGQTSRSNLILEHVKKIDDNSTLKSTFFYSLYDFELYSNFTFFLEDSINGDQIRQKEKRATYGLHSEYSHYFNIKKTSMDWRLGVSLRNDQSHDNELSKTLNRDETISPMQLGDINETNWSIYTSSLISHKKWSFKPSLRLDLFDFQYHNKLDSSYNILSTEKAIISPKLDIYYNVSTKSQFYAKAGKGFHSNDSRVSTAQEVQNTIPAAYGFDIGHIVKPNPNILFSIAYWYLFLEQEFVYVGDAGIVEPSGKTRRHGLETSIRYQLKPWLSWNLDANYTLARAIEESKDEDYIPLAPDFTLNSGLSIVHPSGIYGSINFRYLDDRPANEDNSIIARGYAVTDMNVGYQWKNTRFGIAIINLFNTEWNETQFATESRMQNETTSVEEIHFTPGSPFTIKTSLTYRF